jgi:hypothetical protein
MNRRGRFDSIRISAALSIASAQGTALCSPSTVIIGSRILWALTSSWNLAFPILQAFLTVR